MAASDLASTVAEQIEMILNPKPEADIKSLKVAILRELPQDIKPPTLSNLKVNAGDDVNAWCSFSSHAYDPNNTHNPIAIAEALENVGWQIQPASLAKYGDYRRGVHRGFYNELPNVYSRSELKEADQILPVWVRPCQHTNPDAYFYAKTPNGMFIKVTIDIPGCGAHLHARRVESFGGWYFERGTGRLIHKPQWATMFGGMSQYSKCYVDTEQGISGEIYWNSSELPKASEILAKLLNK